MKALLLVLMMGFIMVSPCQAATAIYNVQFSDNNGVYTGNEDLVICTIVVPNKEKTIATYLMDLSNGMVKVFEVDGRKITGKDEKWISLDDNIWHDVVEYVKLNYSSILQSSRDNPQSAYKVEK